MIGIYKIISPTNKVYIGQSWDIEQRKKSYEWLQCKGQHKVYNSILKHEWCNHKFETIHELPLDVSQETLNQYEIFYWLQYKNCGFEMLNIKEPGLGGKHSNETRLKISNKLKGRIFSEDIKLRMSLGGKGKPRKGAGPKGPLNEEHKNKIREGNKGKIQSEESKNKISKTKGEGIIQLDLQGNFIKEWVSFNKVRRSGYPGVQGSINRKKCYKNYIWLRKKDYLNFINNGQSIL